MPAQSRAQRRRTNARQQPYSAPKPHTGPKVYETPNTGETQVLAETALESPAEVTVPTIAAPAASNPNSRVARRLRTRSAPEPVDYTKDYRDVAKDLRLITIWSVLLFAAMFGLYFARANGLF